jgi:uncharacterized coiled-coil protein SlyX
MMAPETELQTAERHVREGERRIARQEALIRELDRGGHPAATAEIARKVLAAMNESLVLARTHVARLKAQMRLGRPNPSHVGNIM